LGQAARGKARPPRSLVKQIAQAAAKIVRREFYRSYPAEGDAEAKQAVRRKAFNRAITAAQGQYLISIRDVGALTLMWLTDPQNGPTKNV
jgi:hypothetical protein